MERYLLRMVVVLVVWLAAASASLAQTAVEYIHTDALGTPVAVTNSAGAVIERSVYEPYGQLINRPLTDGPGFTGHVQDAATGLTYMQQRYYDPQVGLFLSVDPVAGNGVSQAQFHRYRYANSNPFAFTDPDGRRALCSGGFAMRCKQVFDMLEGEEPTEGPPSHVMQVAPSSSTPDRPNKDGCDVLDDHCGSDWRDGTVLKDGLTWAVSYLLPETIYLKVVGRTAAPAAKLAPELEMGRKLDFLFNKSIDPSVPENVLRALGNSQRIGIADTPANRAEVIKLMNQAFRDPSSIVGPGKFPGSNLREFFLPGVTGTGAKIQFVEAQGKVITIIAK